MIAAIISTGLIGLALIVWRKDVFTLVMGIVLLVVTAGLLAQHWAWLSE
jgi:hypothetical protein